MGGVTTEFTNAFIAVATAIIGLAIISVLISKQANTTSVIKAASDGLGSLIKSAVSPVTGGF